MSRCPGMTEQEENLLADAIAELAWHWADGSAQELRHAARILQHSNYLEGTPVNDYVVTWAFDTEATKPREAAQEARDAQIREGTWATVFDVKDIRTGEVTRVDLLADEDDDYLLYTRNEGTR